VQTHDEADGVHDDARSIGLFVGPRTLGGINYLLSLRSRDIYRYLRDSEVIAWLRSLSLASRSGSRFQMLPTHRSIQIQMTIEHKAGAWCIAASSVDFGNGLTRLVPPTRDFISEQAAVNYVKRIVLRHLRHQGRPETGTDIDCQVQTRSLEVGLS